MSPLISFAIALLNAGTPLDQVAVLLGHVGLETTRVYSRPSERDLEAGRAAGSWTDYWGRCCSQSVNAAF